MKNLGVKGYHKRTGYPVKLFQFSKDSQGIYVDHAARLNFSSTHATNRVAMNFSYRSSALKAGLLNDFYSSRSVKGYVSMFDNV